MNKIIIVPDNLVNLIKKVIITSQHKVLFGVEILSLTQFIKKTTNIATMTNKQRHLWIHEKLYHKLNTNNTFYPLINQVDFINQVTKVQTEIVRYNLDVTKIQEPNTQELFKCLNDDNTEKQVLAFLNSATCEHLQILDASYTHYEYNILIAKLIERGAKLISSSELSTQFQIPSHNIKPTFYANECLTMHEEVEFVVRSIIKSQQFDNTKVYYSDDHYLFLLKNTFEKYGIPFIALDDQVQDEIRYLFVDALNYFQNPNEENHINLLLQHNLYNLNYQELTILKKYYAIFKTFSSLNHLQQLNKHFTYDVELAKQPDYYLDVIFGKYTKEQLQKLEDDTREIYTKIKSLQSRLTLTDIYQYLLVIVEFVEAKHLNDLQVRVVNQILGWFELFQDSLNSAYTLKVITQWIANCSVYPNYIGGVIVSKIGKMIPFQKHTYILGADSKNFNQFHVIDGLFSEAMNPIWNDFRDYPSLTDRYQFYQDNLISMYDTENVLFSFAKLDQEGRSAQLANSVSQLIAESNTEVQIQVFKYNPLQYQRNFQIDQEIAKKIYFKNGELRTSVTQIQTFNQSPLTYFLTYGLKINNQLDYTMNALNKGTLYHYLFEKFVILHGNDYAKVALKKIATIMSLYSQYYREFLLNGYDALFELEIQEMYYLLNESLKKIVVFEEYNFLNQKLLEQKYEYRINGELVITSRIDRIDYDETQNLALLIDYKSSKKHFVIRNFERGIDIQLPTYLLVMNDVVLPNVTILGALYYSMLTDKNGKLLSGINLMQDDLSEYAKLLQLDDYYGNTPKIAKKGTTLSLNLIKNQCREIYLATSNRILAGEIAHNCDKEFKYYNYGKLFGLSENNLDHEYVKWGEE